MLLLQQLLDNSSLYFQLNLTNLTTSTKIRQFFAFIYICLKMSNNIQLHKNDLPDDLNLGNIIAIDGEFMGLNVDVIHCV